MRVVPYSSLSCAGTRERVRREVGGRVERVEAICLELRVEQLSIWQEQMRHGRSASVLYRRRVVEDDG